MLLSLTAAFMIGLIGGSFLPYLPFTAGMLLAPIGVALGWFERRHRVTTRQGLILYGSVLAGVLYWTAYLWVAAGGPLPDLAGKTASKVVGTVVEPVRHAPGRAVIILALSQVGTETSSEKIKGRIGVVWREPDVSVCQGDRVTFMTQLKAPSGLSNPGGFDYADYLERQGIKAVASLSWPDR